MKKNDKASKNNQILVYGKHPFFSVLKSMNRKIYRLYVSEKNKQEFAEFLQKNDLKIPDTLLSYVDANKLDSLFPNKEKNHQGYLMYVADRKKITFDDFILSLDSSRPLPKLLLLDQVLDPHNLGAIIRTAVAFGIYNIIITSFNSTKETPVVLKTSAGLSEVVNLIEVVNLNSAIKDLKNAGYFVIGLDGTAKTNIDTIRDNRNIALVLGNEGKGIRDLVKKNCDELVKIPMEDCVESLNVSVASAITIYELWG